MTWRELRERALELETVEAWEAVRRASKRREHREEARREVARLEATPRESALDGRLIKREAERAARNGLAIGATLKHERRGKVLATCAWEGPRRWRCAAGVHTSISAAANATAKRLGMKSATLDGWLFWGVEKRG